MRMSIKNNIAKVFRTECSTIIHSSEAGDIMISKAVLDINLQFINEQTSSNIILEDGEDIMDFLKSTFKVRELMVFHFDGMGSCNNNLYTVEMEPDRTYIFYQFALNGEFWLLASFTNLNKQLFELFFDLSLLKKDSSDFFPFQFLYSPPSSFTNHCQELISNEYLLNIFVQLDKQN